MRPLDLTGDVYGRITVLRRAAGRAGKRRWLCRCNCGNEFEAYGTNLRTGQQVSCGCWRREQSTKHGQLGTPLYHTWENMLQRVSNPKLACFKNYGGRGIKVFEGWRDYGTFSEYVQAHLGPRPPGFTLDRIDNDGNYEPGNIRWATRSQQQRNQRRQRRSVAA